MTRKLTFPAFALALMVGFSGCELAVENPNQPDRARALAGPDDVETLISSSFQQVWAIGHYWNNANFAFNHMSSRHTATWGNMAMNDLGREPREPLPNTASYRWAYVFEANWGNAYGGISAASDGIRAIEAGLEIGAGGERNARAQVFAQTSQAILSCLLSLWYDQAFIVDETVDIGGELSTVNYAAMNTYAMGKLKAAETAARGASFTLDGSWINGNAWSNTQLADYLLAWQARCAANVPRTSAEADAANWTQIIADGTAGIRNVEVTGEDSSSDTPWWDGLKSLMAENATWHRMHMDWAGMADQSGQYQDWLSFPTEQRTARQMTFVDTRYPANNVNGERGSKHQYNSTIIFRPERGTYRQSHYGDIRHDAYQSSCSFCFFGPMSHMIAAEFDHYKAEGLYRAGDYAGTAAIVNVSRAAAGLPDAPSDATSAVPGPNCTPKKRYDVSGRCGNLQDAMWFEHFEEVFNIFGGLEFWHGRRNNILPAGTALHLPMPAADLEVLQQAIYTFGGVGGEAAAGNPIPPSVVPGNLNSALERATFTLARMEEWQDRMKRAKSTDLVVR